MFFSEIKILHVSGGKTDCLTLRTVLSFRVKVLSLLFDKNYV